MTFGQNSLSLGTVGSFASTGSTAPQLSEIFRFRSGLVTQLDSGSSFTPGNQWFALGRVSLGPAATQAFYGARFQTPNNALVMGYTSLSPNNPRIEWIGDGANTGNLEFRVGLGFGVPGTPAENRLVATMKRDGSTVFGDLLESTSDNKVEVINFGESLTDAIGIKSTASFADGMNVGVMGIDGGGGVFGAGIYGTSSTLLNPNKFAGYFNGRVFATSITRPSDSRLKSKIQFEENTLFKINQLQPTVYEYNNMKELNLPAGLQHGFIAQDLEKVFPELITEVTMPVFDKNGKVESMFKFKSIDYMGMISILTGSIKELNAKIEELEKKLAGTVGKSQRNSVSPSENTKTAFINQNIPNPFADQTTISYQLPEGTNTAEIMVTDLIGKIIKSYPVNRNQSELTIKASEIGSGIFIYSLIQNGQELLSKKMVVK